MIFSRIDIIYRFLLSFYELPTIPEDCHCLKAVNQLLSYLFKDSSPNRRHAILTIDYLCPRNSTSIVINFTIMRSIIAKAERYE